MLSIPYSIEPTLTVLVINLRIPSLNFLRTFFQIVGIPYFTKGKVISFKCLFLVIDASDVTISAVPTNHNTVSMPFRQSKAIVYMSAEL